MGETYTVALLGFGRIGRALYDYVESDPDFELGYVFVRSQKEGVPADKQVTDPSELTDRPVDLVVEAATHEVVADLGETVLESSDLMVLSGSAFVDEEVEERLVTTAEANDTDVYLPHAALLGIDGLVDARDALDTVSIRATKAPSHLDFGYADSLDPDDVDGRTVLYEGPVRGLCELFPRNFNSHAAVALASLGLDDTESKLVADPSADSADHVIAASGDGFDLEIVRRSAIEGVTGDYTLVSIWGSVRRVLDADGGVTFL
ncbi:aspartate dehydrogenase domain-containing protein [Halorussus salinisoli]|uniref:aspartate dehydrogenase domain-containing protein n=1 Tax=Halorussus salinisoli TaxID=2558242 RepID=UPI0010C22191|nr:aspartate dehydrogenase domain-containing protein [Halorussus salinisoli]